MLCGLASTETGADRLFFIDRETELPRVLPVGYPVAGSEILLLDEHGREVGPGEVGEIAVRSRYLALGYWRRPELTAEKFLAIADKGGVEVLRCYGVKDANPNTPTPQHPNTPTSNTQHPPLRIYLTGDLGRMLPDGCLFHLGRKDFQVKVRGYRIETGEVEAALLEQAEIREAIVAAREDRPGDKRLVAYVVPVAKRAPTVSALRRALADTLPDHMVPSAFVMMEALPRTANGKVDRGALPGPGRTRPDLETPFAAPRTPLEQALAAIWAEVLGLDPVGLHDNFLELGGHSLLAAQLLSRVRSAFQVDLALRRFFQAPTVAGLAGKIMQSRLEQAGTEEAIRLLEEVESLADQDAQQKQREAGEA
jgi:hypothetical protein